MVSLAKQQLLRKVSEPLSTSRSCSLSDQKVSACVSEQDPSHKVITKLPAAIGAPCRTDRQ